MKCHTETQAESHLTANKSLFPTGFEYSTRLSGRIESIDPLDSTETRQMACNGLFYLLLVKTGENGGSHRQMLNIFTFSPRRFELYSAANTITLDKDSFSVDTAGDEASPSPVGAQVDQNGVDIYQAHNKYEKKIGHKCVKEIPFFLPFFLQNPSLLA